LSELSEALPLVAVNLISWSTITAHGPIKAAHKQRKEE
jgi:hypothetical protein